MESKKFEPFIPGYTGHIPVDYFDKKVPLVEALQGGHIPGYAGYVHKVKPENYHGRSFGRITSEINRDLPQVDDTFITTSKLNFVDQNKIRCKKASEILGVAIPPKDYIQPTDEELKALAATVRRVDPCERENQEPEQTVVLEESAKLVMGHDYIKDSLPGFTGHNRKVYATNIHGVSYKKAQELAKERLIEEEEACRMRIEDQRTSTPPLFVSKKGQH